MSGPGPANHKHSNHQHRLQRQHSVPASTNHCGSRMRSNLGDNINLPGATESKLLDLLKNEQTRTSNAMVDHVSRPRPLQTYPQVSDAERNRTKPKISATPPPIPVRAPAVPKRTFIPSLMQQRTPVITATPSTNPPPRILPVPQPPKPAPTLFIIPKPPSTSSGKSRSASIISTTSITNSDEIKTDHINGKPQVSLKETFETQQKASQNSSLINVESQETNSRKMVPPLANVLIANQMCYSNVPLTISHVPVVIPMQKSTSNSKISIRQDSSLSSDSFSQTSSPSYTTKTMETPLIPPVTGSGESGRVHYNMMSLNDSSGTKNSVQSKKYQNDADMKDLNGNGALIKSVSTPASLQTIVRFHNGSNMSLHHKIIKDMRRPSSHYVSRIRLHFRLAQVIVNAIALLAIGGGLAAYFKGQFVAYPAAVQIVNNVTIKPVLTETGVNPAPGICLPVIVGFCQYHKVPYNFTVFPNYMGHFGQRDAQQELEVYDAVVDVRCYELAALFLCSVFVPKCGPLGQVVRPCRSLCFETKRRCGFFLDVFGLTLPEYLECELFPESGDPDVCVGHHEVKEAQMRAQKPVCKSGFQCDVKRCIPKDWQCDGHVDCKDQTDELNCVQCSEGMIHCGAERCMAQEHMCDGKVDCPWAQDERNCLRLSEKNGDEGRGQLEVFRPEHQQWVPACITRWDQKSSALDICNLLGYASSNSSRIIEAPEKTSSYNTITKWRIHPNKRSKVNLLKEFGSCPSQSYPTVDLSCTNYVCGKTRKSYAERASKRIVGGSPSKPGDWPFLAALLGGPEEIFYCAGVLIADQWILTASHCVGNHSDVSGWTIQLGITRRHAHSYYGQKMKVRRVVPHPMYNLGVAHDNDVALFQLSTPVTFHEHLLPVCLPPAHKELLPGTVCTVIGWGKKEDKDISEYEPAINEVEVPVLNRDLCNAWLINRDLNVTEGMICAGYKEGGKDACQGDSGGPLLCRDDKDSDRWFVGGIVSWGIKCAHPHLPGVYAYVPKYIPWIKKQMALYSD